MIQEDRVEKAVEFIRDNAKPLADARGRVRMLEHKLKIVKAEGILEATGTVGERESSAYTARAYRDTLDAYEEAVRTEKEIETYIKAAELTIEVWRSQNATNRRGNV